MTPVHVNTHQGTGSGASANAGLVGRTMQWFKLSKPGSRDRVGDIQLMVEVGGATSAKQRDEELGDGLLYVVLPVVLVVVVWCPGGCVAGEPCSGRFGHGLCRLAVVVAWSL